MYIYFANYNNKQPIVNDLINIDTLIPYNIFLKSSIMTNNC